MKNNQHEPIFFTPPSGDTKRPRTLHKGGGGGGDGGAAARKAAEDSRIAAAINKLNQVFGMAEATPDPVDRNAFVTKVPIQNNNNGYYGMGGFNAFGGMGMGSMNQQPQTKSVFNDSAYNAAVAAAQAKADKLKGAAQARESLYSKIGTDATNTALTDLDKERAITERELNFMLARSGLSGGSRDIDANKDVLDTHQQGILKASNLGLEKSNNARSNDEKTRVNLINSIHAGLSDGDAMAQAYQGMANNSRQAQDEANNATLSGFFDVLRSNQEKAQYNQGLNTPISTDTNLQVKKYGSPAVSNYGGKIGTA